MPLPFPATARVLASQSSLGARLLMGSAVAVLAAWGAWFVGARVPVYEASERARLEVSRATHPVDALVTGRVTAIHVALDQRVATGDVLVELDAESERHKLAEARARATGLANELAAAQRQITAESRALDAYKLQLGSALGEADSRLREGEVLTRAARVEVQRAERLYAESIVSVAELERARAEADRRAAAEVGLRAALERVRREASTGEADRRSRLTNLERDAARLEAERANVAETLLTLENEVERRVIRAPASGRIGEIGPARTGAVLALGARVATVVATGDLRVIASYEPARALGRVRAGQRARVRLDGFPWTEYGSLDARVTDVASELRDGRARVELSVDPRANPRIPLQHGLPGVAEITVEEVSPATLVLRAAGRLAPAPAPPPPAASSTPAQAGP